MDCFVAIAPRNDGETVLPGAKSAARLRGERRLLKNRWLADRRAERGFEEIEVAAFIGLLDVPGEHPAIAARVARGGLLPYGTTLFQFGLPHVEIDAARRDVERDLVAVFHQRQRPADIGFRRDMQDAGAVAGAAHARIR